MAQKLQCDTGVAMQDNAAQHWWYSTILKANTISSNTGKLSKTVHLDYFGEEPSSFRLRKLMIAGSIASDEDMQSKWKTIHSILSLILSLLLFP